MDSREGTLDIDMAEWGDESLRCSETWTFAQKTERRRWILQNDWLVTVRLIIPRLRDRGFKSRPRNQFLSTRSEERREGKQNREGKYYIGLSDDVSRRISQHNFGDSRWTRGKGPWILIWQSGEMNLSDARKLGLSLKRQKGGDGFYRMIGLSRFGS